MMKTAKKIIDLALSWKGKKESNGSHKEIIDIYNSCVPLPRGYKVKYSDAWCATFISALSIKLKYTNIIPPECSCEKMIENFKKLGVYVEDENRTPAVGDIVFYDWGDNGKGDCKGWSDHVGIVTNVSRETFTVIEGNYNGEVKQRKMSINGRYLRGFAVPKYEKEVSKPSETDALPFESLPNCITEVAKLVIKGRYGNGHDNRMKAIYTEVRKEVNRLTGN